jgi:hypothetical protein
MAGKAGSAQHACDRGGKNAGVCQGVDGVDADQRGSKHASQQGGQRQADSCT